MSDDKSKAAMETLREALAALREALGEQAKNDPFSQLMDHLEANDPTMHRVLKDLAIMAITGDKIASSVMVIVDTVYKAGVIRGRIQEARDAEKASVPSGNLPAGLVLISEEARFAAFRAASPTDKQRFMDIDALAKKLLKPHVGQRQGS